MGQGCLLDIVEGPMEVASRNVHDCEPGRIPLAPVDCSVDPWYGDGGGGCLLKELCMGQALWGSLLVSNETDAFFLSQL